MSTFKSIYVDDNKYPTNTGVAGQSITHVGTNELEFNYPTANRLKTLTGDITVDMSDAEIGQVLTVITATDAEWRSPIFGTEYQYVEDLTQDQTNSTTWTTKLNLTTPTLPAGSYKISWTYDWNYNATNRFFRGRLRRNGSNISLHRQRPRSTSNNQIYNHMNFAIITLATPDIIDVDLQYRASNTLDTATIDNVKMEIFRTE